MEITIEKSTAELYKLRGTNGSFANISLDYSEKQGRISISTDYGNWSYYWGACGSAFKEFLIGLNMEYAAGKFGEGQFFDHVATLNYLQTRIKENSENKEHKRKLKDELKSLVDCEDKSSFIAQMWNCSEIMKLEDNCPDLVTGISPGFKYFWENLWSNFIQSLKEELETMQPA